LPPIRIEVTREVEKGIFKVTDYAAAQLTDLTPAYSAVRHPGERRRNRAIGIALRMAGVVGVLASIFTGHSPEPSRCDPGPAQTIITRPVSPDTIALDRCPPGGVKYTIR
jgi:hypothetical protein